MRWRTIIIFLGSVIMIGAVVAIAKTMGADIVANRRMAYIVTQHGRLVTYGFLALLFFGYLIVLFGYAVIDDDAKMKSSRSRRQNRRRRKRKLQPL